MKVTVLKGTVVYKGKSIENGATFECDKEVAENLLKANIVSVAEKGTKKGK